MTDVFTTAQRSRIMSAIRSKGNRSTEMALAAAFRASHVTRWRRQYPITGSPDFAFPVEKLAVFVDGCFWHAFPHCCSIPSSNRKFWEAKLAQNVMRDRLIARKLRRKGWGVLRIWEHDLRGAALPQTIHRIKAALSRRKLKLRVTNRTEPSCDPD